MLLYSVPLMMSWFCSVLQGDDTTNSFSVYGREVDIIASKAGSSTQPNPGSNKVRPTDFI